MRNPHARTMTLRRPDQRRIDVPHSSGKSAKESGRVEEPPSDQTFLACRASGSPPPRAHNATPYLGHERHNCDHRIAEESTLHANALGISLGHCSSQRNFGALSQPPQSLETRCARECLTVFEPGHPSIGLDVSSRLRTCFCPMNALPHAAFRLDCPGRLKLRTGTGMRLGL